jgi:hypothetical protein
MRFTQTLILFLCFESLIFIIPFVFMFFIALYNYHYKKITLVYFTLLFCIFFLFYSPLIPNYIIIIVLLSILIIYYIVNVLKFVGKLGH